MELNSAFRADWPLRQGDLIGFWDWTTRRPLDRYGILITADCDIAQGSPTQELVYLRIVTQKDYLDLFWARRKLQKLHTQNLQDLTSSINRHRGCPSLPELSPSDIEAWIKRCPEEEITAALNLNSAEAKKLQRAIDRLKASLVCKDINPGDGCFSILVKCRSTSTKTLLQEAQSEAAKIRDELFFLSGIKDADDQTGYYVLLDRIAVVNREQISNSMYDVRHGEKTAYRFGTLNAPFKYAVSQQFSFLFQRIGLPDQHKQSHINSLREIPHQLLDEQEVLP